MYENTLLDLNEDEFTKISKLVYTRFGINLTEKKRVLVRGRLNKLIRELGMKSFSEYYESVLNDKSGLSLLTLVDKISTNHTYFFRENDHFQYLSTTVLPQIESRLKAEDSNDIRIWCAGCSSGEEAYTLAIVLQEYFGSHFFNEIPVILGTDISLSALKIANEGYYSVEKVRTIPEPLRRKYFIKEDSTTFRVKDSLRKMVLFKRLNFINERFPFKNLFHLIFFRNVMIYFDLRTKNDIIGRIHQVLDQDGYLFIGHSETLNRDLKLFAYVKPAVYKKWKDTTLKESSRKEQ